MAHLEGVFVRLNAVKYIDTMILQLTSFCIFAANAKIASLYH